MQEADVVIVDVGMGNLFSVKQACAVAGLRAETSSDPEDVARADALILPGVGAFGDAMEALRALRLTEPLRAAAREGKPILGICLGLQLLMERSHEFGAHTGLGLVPGEVVRFDKPQGPRGPLKVPQVGWNRVWRTEAADPWAGLPLEGTPDGAAFYFVHSYHARPPPGVEVAWATYGDTRFCAALRSGNVFAVQFHPERSGPAGLQLYQRWADQIHGRRAGS